MQKSSATSRPAAPARIARAFSPNARRWSYLLLLCLLTLTITIEKTWAQQRPATGAYPGSTAVGQATFSNDPETRKLIVVTDEETANQIRQVITNLDRPVPQVLIKVVFLEVTYRKGLDFGIEGTHRREIGSTTTGAINQVFGLGAQGALPTPPGAGIYQILGSDFQATLRAIAEAGKTEVLSRPSVLTRNNQQAVITVGQQIPLITNVRYDTFGNQINAVTYTDVGIILRVTPFITSDGMVEMIVFPEISNLSDRTVPISAGVNAPVINSRSADTVVITPDGQTVVIGGLMENNKTSTDSKIPVLGDIPLLGNLFKRKVRNDEKTELLIFLTPYIVKRPSDLAAITTSERARTQLVPQAFSDQELDRFFDQLEAQPDPAPRRRGR
jgi:type II secretion system protein D